MHEIRPTRKTLPVGITLFKVNNGNTTEMCEIRAKSSRKIPERRHVFLVNFEQISHIGVVSPLSTLSKCMPDGLVQLLQIIFQCLCYFELVFAKGTKTVSLTSSHDLFSLTLNNFTPLLLITNQIANFEHIFAFSHRVHFEEVFQGVQKCDIGLKWVKILSDIYNRLFQKQSTTFSR